MVNMCYVRAALKVFNLRDKQHWQPAGDMDTCFGVIAAELQAAARLVPFVSRSASAEAWGAENMCEGALQASLS